MDSDSDPDYSPNTTVPSFLIGTHCNTAMIVCNVHHGAAGEKSSTMVNASSNVRIHVFCSQSNFHAIVECLPDEVTGSEQTKYSLVTPCFHVLVTSGVRTLDILYIHWDFACNNYMHNTCMSKSQGVGRQCTLKSCCSMLSKCHVPETSYIPFLMSR